MARNEEKAQSMLNRWLTYKRDLMGTRKHMGKRPAFASDCDNIPDCERWRMQIIREIGKKIVEIQNESLGEQRLRDLNDEINKSMREKAHWERRILELGGPNYRKYERIADEALMEGAVPAPNELDQRGSAYKYFGASKNLPGVKELLQAKAAAAKNKRQRIKIDMRGIDASYYGYNEDEDGLLEQVEQESEKKAIEEAVKEWATNHQGEEAPKNSDSYNFVAHFEVPSKEAIEERLIERRKELLLKKFLYEDKEAAVLGKRKADQ